ncbi:hypothetical protein CEXT_592171 [Caerostris extrusa]|uniref:Uncharacterized protein n=1 Tax=Caerostris extrusa TaxID=172846 RepID=A0AAV4SMC9_CAEEX|nr:hypothetical protein CEXT_592171 [Caerostris extrusa]
MSEDDDPQSCQFHNGIIISLILATTIIGENEDSDASQPETSKFVVVFIPKVSRKFQTLISSIQVGVQKPRNNHQDEFIISNICSCIIRNFSGLVTERFLSGQSISCLMFVFNLVRCTEKQKETNIVSRSQSKIQRKSSKYRRPTHKCADVAGEPIGWNLPTLITNRYHRKISKLFRYVLISGGAEW